MNRVRRVLSGLALAVALGSALAGCVGSTPAKSPTPSAKPTPLYSSDAKALAATQAALDRYVTVSNKVAQGGWRDTTPLKSVATGDALRADIESAEKNNKAGLHSTGDATGLVKSVQGITANGVSTYVCIDVSQTRVLSGDGTDKTDPNRPTLVGFQTQFERTGQSLLHERGPRWTGSSFC